MGYAIELNDYHALQHTGFIDIIRHSPCMEKQSFARSTTHGRSLQFVSGQVRMTGHSVKDARLGVRWNHGERGAVGMSPKKRMVPRRPCAPKPPPFAERIHGNKKLSMRQYTPARY